jgi:cytochrome P450
VPIQGYDPFSAEFQADPFSVYKWMRDEAPVYYNPKWDWWALSRWDDVRAAALDPETFLSYEGIDLDATATDQGGPGFLPNVDNPRHDQIRGVVQPPLLPRRVAAYEETVRTIVRGLVDEFRDRGTVDIVQELAWPMPNEVFFDVFGLPHGRDGRDDLQRWIHELKDRVPDNPNLTPVARAATDGINAYFISILNERRREPRQDLISHIVQGTIDGTPFADEEITPESEVMGLMRVLFLGGVESTAGLTGSCFKLLAEHPDQRRLLLDDPSLIPDAVEEAIRWSTPLQHGGRTTSREVTIHGVTIPRDGRVVLVYGSANRDERQFEDPDDFLITRGRVRHLGFSEGIHGCLGAPLARLELKVALEEALPILGEYELTGEAIRYRTTPNMYVWNNLPVSFTPQAAAVG